MPEREDEQELRRKVDDDVEGHKMGRKIDAEGDDVEGHKMGRKIDAEGDDVEGHKMGRK